MQLGKGVLPEVPRAQEFRPSGRNVSRSKGQGVTVKVTLMV